MSFDASSGGSSRRGRRRRSSMTGAGANINVTSLLDITLVLLIAFMVVTPALNNGINVKLPEATAGPLEEDSKGIVISVAKPDPAGPAVSYLGEDEVSVEDLEDRLAEAISKDPKVSVSIRGDKTASWEDMAVTIAAVKRSGVEGFSLVTEASKPSPKIKELKSDVAWSDQR